MVSAGGYVRYPTIGTPPPPAWNPGTEPGLVAWFRADTLALSGSTIVSWLDKGPNGYNATPFGTPAAQQVTNVINGQPVVRFVSANAQYFTFASGHAIISKNSAYTLFYVMKNAAQVTNGNFSVFLSLISDAVGGYWSSYFNQNGVAGYTPLEVGGGTAGSDTGTGLTTDYFSNFYALTSIFNGGGSLSTGANYQWYKNGVSLGALSDQAGAVNTGSQPASGIGIYYGGPYHPDCDIAEIAIWDHALGAPAQTNLNTYRNTRYAI